MGKNMISPKKRKAMIRDTSFGSNCVVYEPANIYGSQIGDNCLIGPFVEIQKNSKVGNNTRVQSHSFICELVEIGSDCFIGHGVVFINDKFILDGPSGEKHWQATKIGKHVSIGSNSTILPVKICDNTVIGAGSVVTKDILKPGVYAGNPARLIRELNEKD